MRRENPGNSLSVYSQMYEIVTSVYKIVMLRDGECAMIAMSSVAVRVLPECCEQEYVQPSISTWSTLSLRNRLHVVSPIQQLETHTKQELADKDLMAAMCFGAEWATEVLYQRYYKYAYALAYRIVHDNALADDIVQDVFLAVWHKAASYRELYGSVRTWLLAIVRHRAIDCVRTAMSRNYQCTSLQGEVQDPPSKESELWEHAWQQERDIVLHRTLAQLPFKQRQVIELRYFDGSTDAEIANYLELPLGTVKGRIRLGLQKMRQLLCMYGVE